MATLQTCSECGRPLTSDASEGFCPACMLEGALQLGEVQSSKLKAQTAGKRFGDYELLDEIARGGMGVVYRARQISLDRIVAVKLILFGSYAGETSVRRFRAEAAAAARLQHPNIVAIHDVGEEAGQHFFSMDCVEGQNLADHARSHPMTARQAARLVQSSAEAIHYAHGQGIVHRDLKPSNILIDATGNPRITDFGLAKLVGTRSTASHSISGKIADGVEPVPTDDLSLTLTGQVLGSPSYVPPEQASGKRGQVGASTDVYSLGAILYFLLTGRPPFAAETITDTLRQVMNEEPVPPRLLNPSLPRDMETICLKCLEKDPLKRYRTAQELADELGRFLRTEPILARPVSPPEKFWRWCRRQPALASALALLLVVAIGSPIAAVRINGERRDADAARKQAEANEKIAAAETAKSRQIATFLQDMLKGAGPSAALGRDTTILREILDQTASRLKADLAGQPEVEAALRATLGNVYNQLGEYTNGTAMLHEALRLYRSVDGEHPDIARLLHDLAWTASGQANFDEAEEMSREALRLQRKFYGDEHWSVAATLSQLGDILRSQSKFDDSEKLHREALAMQRKLHGNDHPLVGSALHLLGLMLLEAGRCSEAETTLREVYSIKKRIHPKEHPDLVPTMELLGLALERQDKFDEAAAVHRDSLVMARRLYGAEHPIVAFALTHVAEDLNRRGQWAEAEDMFRESLAIRRKFLGRDNPSLVYSLDPLARELGRQGKWAEAEILYRESLAIREKKLPNEWLTFLIRSQLGVCLAKQEEFAEAEPLLVSGYEGMKQREDRIPASSRRFMAIPIWSLLDLYKKTGQPAKAAEWKSRLPQPEQR